MGIDQETQRALDRAAELAREYLEGLPERYVGGRADAESIIEALGPELAQDGQDAEAIIEHMAQAVDPGLVASAGPRFFGFVFGGAVPASVAADWLTAAWDQNAFAHASSPAGAAVEELSGRWMLDLLGLPEGASVGFPAGTGLGNAVALAAARHAVLARLGWDAEADGLYGAPEIAVVVGDEVHATLESALQFLGLGRSRVVRVTTDAQGAMSAEAFRAAMEGGVGASDALIVNAQAGNVNTGAFDPIVALADALEGHPNAWLHVDGAFGLWAAASPRYRNLVSGLERADSWATDAHKWLNVGYDCGFVATRHPDSHRAAMSTYGAYLMHDGERRDNWEWVLDASRRARGFAVYATLRWLGRSGVTELVDRFCGLASLMAERLDAAPDVDVLNDVVLNQVLVRFHAPGSGGDAAADDAFTNEVIRRVQAEGVAWLGGTTWRDQAAMRISVSNWMTTEADVVATADSILRAATA